MVLNVFSLHFNDAVVFFFAFIVKHFLTDTSFIKVGKGVRGSEEEVGGGGGVM